MPLTLKVADRGMGVVLKTVSPVSGEEIVEGIRSFLREETDAFAGARYWYADHLASGVVAADPDDTWRVAATTIKAARVNPGLVVAVCAPTSSAFVLSEVWKAFSAETGWEVRVFRLESEAKAWLRAKVQDDLTFT